MKLAVSRELFAYWDRLRGARAAPERDDIEPGAIRGILADTFILEFDPGKGFPMRIAGSRTNALFARELRNMAFLQCWAQRELAEIAEILTLVADEVQPVILGANGRPEHWDSVELEVLLLPLRHHGDTHSRILGAMAFHALPSWLGLTPAPGLQMTSMRTLERRQRAAGVVAIGQGGQVKIFGAAPAIERRGHLFVHSDAPSAG